MSIKKIITYVTATVCVAIVICAYIYVISRAPRELEFFIFDTPGSPSIFIRTPDDTRILIDGGSNSEIIRHLTEVLPFYSHRIDEVILTNADAVHSAGLIDVINRYNVGRVTIPSVTSQEVGIASSTDATFQILSDTILAHHVPIEPVGMGDEIHWNGIHIDVLFPAGGNSFTYSKASSPMLILHITYGKTSFTLLGNSSTKIQRFVASSTCADLFDAQSGTHALIIFHTISTTALSNDLIAGIKPQLVIYSQSITKNVTSRSNTHSTTHSSVGAPIESKDPLYSVLSDHRFNLKQKSAIEALSDGVEITVR